MASLAVHLRHTLSVLLLAGSCVAFEAVWNAPVSLCHTCPTRLNVTSYGVAANRNLNWFGDKMVILYGLGEFPTLHADTSATPCWVKDERGCSWNPWVNITARVNGGVPQEANLTAHLAKVAETVAADVPANFTGLLVIDWEAWRVPFKENYDWQSVYQVYSRQLVAAAHPEWNTTQVDAAAQEAFNRGAETFFNVTLALLRELRPHAQVGFYSYPLTSIEAAENDWLWQQVDLLVPSFYASPGESLESMVGRVNTHVANCRQASQRFPSLKCYMYALDGVFLTVPPTEFTSAAAMASIVAPALSGLDGIVLWGSSSSVRDCSDCTVLEAAWVHAMGNTLASCLEAADLCSATRCQGRHCALAANITAQTVATLGCSLLGRSDTPVACL